MPIVSGFRPSPSDPRDRPFESHRMSARMGGSVVVLDQTTPISDQGMLSSCVGNATVDAIELLSRDPVQLSRLFCYYWSRYSHGEQHADNGTYIRAAFASLQKVGTCREEFWTYDPRAVNVEPGLFARENAYDHRMGSYFAIDYGEMDDVEIAIRSGLPVVFGVAVGDDFPNYVGGNVTWDRPAHRLGGHAMVVVGVEHDAGRRRFLVRNSWGVGWGLRERPGHCYFSEDYLAAASELWVPTIGVMP
jgi:hypothetical protein